MFKLRIVFCLQIFQFFGILVKQGAQRIGRLTDHAVIAVDAVGEGLADQVPQIVHLPQNHAVVLILVGAALAHLIQNAGNVIEARQLLAGRAHVGRSAPVLQIQARVPQLDHAGGENALADSDIVNGRILI